MNVSATAFTVLYNTKNITADIAKYLLSLTYKDKTHGESDEIEIELEDVDALWRNGWYPDKGAKLTVTIGLLKCGIFEIDEIAFKGPPSVVSIRAMATGITSSLRTKKSDAHENKTLQQIAQKVAAKNNLTVEGTVPGISIGRVTQNKETDLAFLKRVAGMYGVVFSVRDTKIIFTSVYDLEKRASSFVLDVTDLSAYNLKDKADGAKKSTSVHGNAKANEKIQADKDYKDWQNEDGYKYPDSASEDEEVDYSYSENKQQAEAKAKAVMHLSAKNQFEGNIEISNEEFYDLACAGNNFQLNGIGKLSGKYHIESSTHKLDKSGGRTVDCEIKRLQLPEKSTQITVKKHKQQPKTTPVFRESQVFKKPGDRTGIYEKR